MATALDLVYGAEILDAQKTMATGLARSVHEPDKLLDAARALAGSWTAGRSPVGVALTRQMMYRNAAFQHPADAHRADSLSMFYTSLGDGAEGVAAFRAKRDVRFTASAAMDMPPFYDDWIRSTEPRSGSHSDAKDGN
jgi:enoyl-CoA hydratase/carnithine racemase